MPIYIYIFNADIFFIHLSRYINFDIKFSLLDIMIIFVESEKDRHRIKKKNDKTTYLYCFINKYIYLLQNIFQRSHCVSHDLMRAIDTLPY